MSNQTNFEYLGEVAVDSGTLAIVDGSQAEDWPGSDYFNGRSIRTLGDGVFPVYRNDRLIVIDLDPDGLRP